MINIKNFILVFDLKKNKEQKKIEIKKQLYKEEIKSVTPIGPSNDLYEIKATRSEMERIFESLEPFIEDDERMFYNSTDGFSRIHFGFPQKEVIVNLM